MGHARALLGTPDRAFQEQLAAHRGHRGPLGAGGRGGGPRSRRIAAATTPMARSVDATRATQPLRPPGLAELEELLGDHLDTRVKISMSAERGQADRSSSRPRGPRADLPGHRRLRPGPSVPHRRHRAHCGWTASTRLIGSGRISVTPVRVRVGSAGSRRPMVDRQPVVVGRFGARLGERAPDAGREGPGHDVGIGRHGGAELADQQTTAAMRVSRSTGVGVPHEVGPRSPGARSRATRRVARAAAVTALRSGTLGVSK